MKVILAVLLWVLPTIAVAQMDSAAPVQRSGFIFGAAAGAGLLDLTGDGVSEGQHLSPSFPNLRIGYMVSPRTAVVVLLPGTIYRYEGVGEQDRPRDRGFEGIIPSIQYWVADRWWIMGGAGLTLDAPTFYDVQDASEGKYYMGPSLSVGAGYEVWRRGSFSLDAQTRLHYGSARLADGETRKGTAWNLLLGVNVH
jgi:hypothetical protein